MHYLSMTFFSDRLLVIVNQINIAHITVIEPENNPPVARDSDAPEPPQVTPATDAACNPAD